MVAVPSQAGVMIRVGPVAEPAPVYDLLGDAGCERISQIMQLGTSLGTEATKLRS